MFKLPHFLFLLIGISTASGTNFQCHVGNLLANWYCEDYCKSLDPGNHVAGSCAKDEVSCLCEISGNKTIIVRILQNQAPVPATVSPAPFVNAKNPIGTGFQFQQPVPQRLVCDGSTTATQMCNSFCINTKGARNGVCNVNELTCRCIGVPFISNEPIPDFFYQPQAQLQNNPVHFRRPILQPQQQQPANLNAQNPMQNFYRIRQDAIPPQQPQQPQQLPSSSFPLRPPQTLNSFNSFQQPPPNNFPQQQQQQLLFSSQQQPTNFQFNPAETRPVLNQFPSRPVTEPTVESQTISNLPHDIHGFTLSPELENFNVTSTTESSTPVFEDNVNNNNNDNLQNHHIERPTSSAPTNKNNSPPIQTKNNERLSFSL